MHHLRRTQGIVFNACPALNPRSIIFFTGLYSIIINGTVDVGIFFTEFSVTWHMYILRRIIANGHFVQQNTLITRADKLYMNYSTTEFKAHNSTDSITLLWRLACCNRAHTCLRSENRFTIRSVFTNWHCVASQKTWIQTASHCRRQ